MTDPFADHLLYDAAWAPSPRRLRWFLAEKGITLPTRVVDLRAGEHLGAQMLAENSSATVPALRLPSGEVLADGEAIARLVEAMQPEPALFGRTPDEVGRVTAWVNRIDREGYGQIADWLRNDRAAFADRPIPGARSAGVAQIPALAERGVALWRHFAAGLEDELGTGWLVGEFGFADIALAVACDFADAVKLDWTAGPALTDWRARAAARPGAGA